MGYLSSNYLEFEDGIYRSSLRKPQRNRADNCSSLSTFFATTVCGSYKQDISFMLVGNKGKGKSSTGLTLGYHTARKVAQICDRDEDNWQDYFNIDHVAIIKAESALDVLKHVEKHDIVDFDDVAVGWNARNFNNKENKDRNDVFQINRIDETVQIFTLPAQFLIDKVPRQLVSHYGEMARADFPRGIATFKFFRPITLHRINKQIHPFLYVDRKKYVEYVCHHDAPKALYDEYDKRRDQVTREEKSKRLENLENSNPERKASSAEIRRENKKSRILAFLGVYDYNLNQGQSDYEARKNACKELDIPLTTVSRWKHEGAITKIRGEI